MSASLPDFYVSSVPEGLAFQGASQAAIDHLSRLHGPLARGTIAVVAPEDAQEVFAAIDHAGLQTMTLG